MGKVREYNEFNFVWVRLKSKMISIFKGKVREYNNFTLYE